MTNVEADRHNPAQERALNNLKWSAWVSIPHAILYGSFIGAMILTGSREWQLLTACDTPVLAAAAINMMRRLGQARDTGLDLTLQGRKFK